VSGGCGNLAVQVLTALGEGDAAVTDTEMRAGAAWAQMTDVEGLTLAQAVEWCGEDLSLREATRLRQLSTAPRSGTGRADGGSGGHNGGQSQPSRPAETTDTPRVATAAADKGRGGGAGSAPGWAGLEKLRSAAGLGGGGPAPVERVTMVCPRVDGARTERFRR